MKTVLSLTAAALVTLAAAEARAADAVALVGDATLVSIDLATGRPGAPVAVTGVGRLLGIDVRPADQRLYGVTVDGAVVTIDARSGATAKVAQLDMALPGAPDRAIVDFNPAADKLRFMGTDGTNFRVDPVSGKVTRDGALAFEPGDANQGGKPMVVAAAYSNARGKPEKTAMYDIDATLGALVQQVRPNDGALKAIGKLGIPMAKSYAFDVATAADGTNTAWLVADRGLFKVALDTGAATKVTEIEGISGAVRDLAVTID